MAFWTYLLRCSDGRFYTGHTDNLEHRVAQHQAGEIKDCYTFKRRPVALVWSESFGTRLEALEAERIVSGWSRAKKEALIREDWKTVSLFARPLKERFSTSLEAIGDGENSPIHSQTPFVSSEVEKPSSPRP